MANAVAKKKKTDVSTRLRYGGNHNGRVKTNADRRDGSY